MKVYLLFHLAITASPVFRGRKRPAWEAELTQRLTSAIGGFSLTRCVSLSYFMSVPRTRYAPM